LTAFSIILFHKKTNQLCQSDNFLMLPELKNSSEGGILQLSYNNMGYLNDEK